jgi:hypothetical protein
VYIGRRFSQVGCVLHVCRAGVQVCLEGERHLYILISVMTFSCFGVTRVVVMHQGHVFIAAWVAIFTGFAFLSRYSSGDTSETNNE